MNGAKEEGRSDVVVAVVADDFRNKVVVAAAAGVVDTSEVAVISPRSPIVGCSEDYAVAVAVVVACLDVIDTEDWDCCVPS